MKYEDRNPAVLSASAALSESYPMKNSAAEFTVTGASPMLQLKLYLFVSDIFQI
jgi:hypothetical protein